MAPGALDPIQASPDRRSAHIGVYARGPRRFPTAVSAAWIAAGR